MKHRIWMCMLLGMLIFILTLPTDAAEENITAQFEEEMQQFIDALPEEIDPALRDSLVEPEGISETMQALDFSTLWDHVTSSFASAFPSAAALMLRLFVFLICCSLFNGWKNAVGNGLVTPAWELCSTLCIATVLADSLSVLINTGAEYITAVTSLVNGVTPIACAVSAASGNLTAAAVGRASLMLLYTLFQNLHAVFLLPAVRLAFCFGIVGSVSTAIRMEAISRCIRRVFTWILALLALLLTFIIGAQSIIARSADSFTMRTVKFALGSFIPLVGGALSDALGTAAGSLSLIRNTCGIVCAASVILLGLPVLLQLLLHRAALVICQGAAELVGCDREGKLIGEMHGILGYILAIVAMVSLLFLLVLTLVIGIPGTGG